MDEILSRLEAYRQKGLINAKFSSVIRDFYESYQQALASSSNLEKGRQLFGQLLELIIDNIRHPRPFSIFHRSVRHPFDYYQFGLDFIRPCIDFPRSKVSGSPTLDVICEQLKRRDNIILFANHQTEPDPPIISLLLEKSHPQLASEMVFVAGDRVTTDPSAIPMSLGRHLLCIHSKKHMAYPPEQKTQKILHNRRTLQKIQELLDEGGYCIYVAPSGGRDRPNEKGEVTPAPFDPSSIECFWLMGRQARRPTHFYPLTLHTYHLMPPPLSVEQELGERRSIHFSPIYLSFGQEIDMDHFPGSEGVEKKILRTKRAEYIWQQVCESYRAFE